MITEMQTIEQIREAWEGRRIVKVQDFTPGQYLQVTLDDGQSYEMRTTMLVTNDCVLMVRELADG